MSLLGRTLLATIALYRKAISPLLGAHCRFAPTCSEYAAEAIRTHGALRGGWLALKRVGRCHPWSAGGVDHVPPPVKGRPRPDLQREKGRPRPDLQRERKAS